MNPFKIELSENKEMKAWDLHLQVGNFQSKKNAEDADRALAEFMEGENGWFDRQH